MSVHKDSKVFQKCQPQLVWHKLMADDPKWELWEQPPRLLLNTAVQNWNTLLKSFWRLNTTEIKAGKIIQFVVYLVQPTKLTKSIKNLIKKGKENDLMKLTTSL